MQQLYSSFKALGDPIRLRLFSLLAQYDELCVCHLVDTLNLPQSTISRHLAVLRHANLVSTHREGKWMYYQLHGDISQVFSDMIQQQNEPQIEQDTKALQRILDNI